MDRQSFRSIFGIRLSGALFYFAVLGGRVKATPQGSRKEETMPRPSGARGCRKQETARRPAGGSRKHETMGRPSRASQKRPRAGEKTRLKGIWPSFINLPWNLWASSINSAGCPPMAATGSPAHGAKDAATMGDAVITAKPNRNIAVMGREAAFDLAVAEGEIDDMMQKCLANEACREFAAFELFFSSAAGHYSSPRYAGMAWRRLSPETRSHWMRQVDGDVCTDMFRRMEARKEGLAAGLLSSKLFGGGVTDDGEIELLAAIQGGLKVIQGESELLAVIRRLVDGSEEEEGPVVDNEPELDDDERLLRTWAGTGPLGIPFGFVSIP